MGVKEIYTKLAKAHHLPSFDKVDQIFEISIIEEEDFLLREVRRKIGDKLEAYTKILEEILQPDGMLSSIYESRAFTEEERDKIFKLYQRFMFLNRMALETSINEDDKKTSHFISAVFKEWDDLSGKFAGLIGKAKDSWLKETDVKEKVGYLG